MITIEKTSYVAGVANDITMVRIQELIVEAKRTWGWVGKAVIDTEKITYYKFGLKLGIQRFSTNGLVINTFGIIEYRGLLTPTIDNEQVLKDLYHLFGKRCPFGRN